MTETLFPEACDCHVHVVGSTDRFPQAAHGSYTALPAMLETLRAVAEPVGVNRFVVVQPSFYGSDNSCLFQALEHLGDSGRGVAVVDVASSSAGVLESYQRRGVCGLRLNFYSSTIADADRILERSLKQTADILPRGWHIEIIARAGTLAMAASIIARAEVPIVIDHYGLPEREAPAEPVGRALVELATLPNVWTKLSAPYRCGPDHLSTSPPSEWLAAFLQAAPNRLIWGSDWPHTPPRSDAPRENGMLPYRKIAYTRLFDDFVDALGSQELARRILVENPMKLFGFTQDHESGLAKSTLV